MMRFLELTISGGIFILAIALFRALMLRRLPKQTFVTLWWAAALRLLVPVELPSRFSVYTLLDALEPQAAAPVSAPAAPVLAVMPLPAAVVPSRPAPAPFPVWTALWAAGAVLLAAVFLTRYIRWRRRFRESLPADCPGLETWFSFRRKVRLRTTDRIAAPLTYGILRPVILLPGTMDLRDEEALTCVLAHETAHIRHLDGLLKLALTAALCLHWFNPAAWLLCLLANRDMELRCDEAAVLALGENRRKHYALTLIRLAEKNCMPLCGFSQRRGMEERIRAIMRIKKQSLAACAAALALALGITTAFATSAKPWEAEGPGQEDLIDRELHAQSSAESAAQWADVLAPYEPFGLSWTFDDPDLDGNGLSMTWEGHEVSGIYDQAKGIWITEHTGNGAYGPGAVELYTVYEDGRLAGLRLATEEEQKAFDRDRQLSSDTLKVELLAESVHYDSGHIYFTIPESNKPWSIFIDGQIATVENGKERPVHYLREESEQAEWIPRMTYSFEVEDAPYNELTMDVKYGDATYCYPLTPLLPGGRRVMDWPVLPEGKEGIPEGVTIIWPVDSTEITNGFGSRAAPGGESRTEHSGVDIGGMEQGAPIYAAAAGTVKDAGFNSADGNYVRLDHGDGLETFYAHCWSVKVKTGGAVALGQTIATVGSTGNSTGPHLHFEISRNGVPQNPEKYWPAAEPAGQEGSKDLTVDPPAESGNQVPGPQPAAAPEAEPQAAPEQPAPQREPGGKTLQREQLVDGDYPTNSRGETYGNTFGHELTGREPDLTAAVNPETGVHGYISMEDMNLTWSPDPNMIIAYQNWKDENQVTGYTIPLYDQEHNVIGDFQVGEGGPGSRTYEEMKEAKAQGWPNQNGSTPVEKEPIFKSLEEAQAAAENGWVGTSEEGYYDPNWKV